MLGHASALYAQSPWLVTWEKPSISAPVRGQRTGPFPPFMLPCGRLQLRRQRKARAARGVGGQDGGGAAWRLLVCVPQWQAPVRSLLDAPSIRRGFRGAASTHSLVGNGGAARGRWREARVRGGAGSPAWVPQPWEGSLSGRHIRKKWSLEFFSLEKKKLKSKLVLKGERLMSSLLSYAWSGANEVVSGENPPLSSVTKHDPRLQITRGPSGQRSGAPAPAGPEQTGLSSSGPGLGAALGARRRRVLQDPSVRRCPRRGGWRLRPGAGARRGGGQGPAGP